MERKIDYVIKQYIELFPFEKTNMLKIWSGLKYFQNEENNYLDLLHIESLSKSQLIKLCRKYNQKVSGNKPELIKRLKKKDSEHYFHAFVTFVDAFTDDKNKRKQLVSKWETHAFDFSEYQNNELEYKKLLSYPVTVLKGMCKKYKLKSAGKRDILIERLDQFSNGKQNKKKTKKSIKKTKNAVFQKKSVNFLNETETYLVKTIEIKGISSELYQFVKSSKINISKYNLVLNSDFLVVGKLDKNEKNIIELTKDDIKVCKSYDLSFNIPVNLD